MTTSEKIKQLRINKGLSQDELGKMIGVQRAAINKYEKGTVVNIKRSTLEKLAEVFNVSPADLLDDYEPLTTDELALFFLNRTQVRDSILNLLGYSVSVELSEGINNLILVSDKGEKYIPADKVEEILTDTISYFEFALNKALQD